MKKDRARRRSSASGGSIGWLNAKPKQGWPWYTTFSHVANYLCAFASQIWLLLWLIGPEAASNTSFVIDSKPLTPAWTGHSVLFALFAASCYLASLGCWFEGIFGARSDVDWLRRNVMQTVFILVYGIASLCLVVVYTGFLKDGPPTSCFPPVATLLWMACLGTATSFVVYGDPIKLTMHVISEDDSIGLTITVK